MAKIYLYNSLTKRKEEFKPINPHNVGMYSCGFTVYSHAHIGHLKRYVGDDILKRVLFFNGYEVKHVHNVTDVGHLVSDRDAGEDKMEKSARKFGLSVFEVALKFEKEFYEALDLLNIIKPDIIQRATSKEAINKQIEFIEILLSKDFAYIKEKAIYFDVSKLPEYNPFAKLNVVEKQQLGAREEVEVDEDKKNQNDFVLWFFRKGKYKDHALYWDSRWGEGFPGWHIECSAISILNLGERFDIHTGGIDHRDVHHPNEIAQNYGVLGHDVVKFWVHHGFLVVNGKKMSKSLDNFYTINDVVDKGFSPMALRYFSLTANYRSQLNFTWEALEGVDNAYKKLLRHVNDFKGNNGGLVQEGKFDRYVNEFRSVVNDDLNTCEGLAVLWKTVQDNNLNGQTKLKIIKKIDEVFGLDLLEGNTNVFNPEYMPRKIQDLINERNAAKQKKDYKRADNLGMLIEKAGYKVEDLVDGTKIYKT